MRSIIWFLLLFAVAVVAATTLGTNDGVVSIYWGSWRFDTSYTSTEPAFAHAFASAPSPFSSSHRRTSRRRST